GVYGSAAVAHYPPSWPSPTRGEGTRERSSGDETSLSCDQCPPVVPLLSPRPTSSNLLLTVPDRLNWGAKRLRHGSFALALAEQFPNLGTRHLRRALWRWRGWRALLSARLSSRCRWRGLPHLQVVNLGF